MPQGQQEDASGWGTSFGYAVLLGLWEIQAIHGVPVARTKTGMGWGCGAVSQ